MTVTHTAMVSSQLTHTVFQLCALEPLGVLLRQAPTFAAARHSASASACTTAVADGAGPRDDGQRCPGMGSLVQLQLLQLQLQLTPRRLQAWTPSDDRGAQGQAQQHLLPGACTSPEPALQPQGLTHSFAEVLGCHPVPGPAMHSAAGHALLGLGPQPYFRRQQQHHQLGSSTLSAPSPPWPCGQGHRTSAPGPGPGPAAEPTRHAAAWSALQTGRALSGHRELPGAPSGSDARERDATQLATGTSPSGSGAGAGTGTPGTGPASGGGVTEVGSSTGTGTDAGSTSGAGTGGSGWDDDAEPPPVPLDPDVKPPGLLFVTGGAAASALLAVTVAALGILGTFYVGWAISSMAKELRRQQHGEEGNKQQQQRKEQQQEQAKQAPTVSVAHTAAAPTRHTAGQQTGQQQQQSAGPVAQQGAGPQQAGGTGGTARGRRGWSWWIGRGWLWGRSPWTQQPRDADGPVGEGAAGPAASG